MKCFLLLLVTILASQALTMASNPGLKLKLLERGLDFAAKVAVSKLFADVKTKPLPNISGTSGRITYEISNVRVVDLTEPESSVTTDVHTGITLTLKNVGLSVRGNWHYEWKWWFIKIRDSGTFDLSASGIKVLYTFDIGVDSNNKPTMWITSRSCQVDNVHMRFHGGRSRFYNIFSGYVEKKLSSQIRSTIINVMDDLINERLNKTLSNIKGTVLINNVITMDNQLLASPHLGHNYIQSSHKGEMFWTSQPGAVPFSPAPMEEPLGTSKMMTLCLSDYVGNSLGYAFYTYGTSYLRRTLTESDLPASDRHLLKTATYPEIASGYPADSLELSMYATEQPTVHTDDSAIKGNFRGIMTVKVKLPTGELVTLLEKDANMETDITAELKDDSIIANVEYFTFDTTLIKANVSSETQIELTNLMNLVAEKFIVPRLNDVGRIGIPLPALPDVKYSNAEVHLLKDAVCFSTDLKYES